MKEILLACFGAVCALLGQWGMLEYLWRRDKKRGWPYDQ